MPPSLVSRCHSSLSELLADLLGFPSTGDIKSQDAVYVLSYSVIMLNTDLHNPQVRVSLIQRQASQWDTDHMLSRQKRMDIDAYSRNLRGVNDNSDFDPDYLVSQDISCTLVTPTDS